MLPLSLSKLDYNILHLTLWIKQWRRLGRLQVEKRAFSEAGSLPKLRSHLAHFWKEGDNLARIPALWLILDGFPSNSLPVGTFCLEIQSFEKLGRCS